MLSLALDRLAQQHRWSRDFTLHSLRRVLREVVACFPGVPLLHRRRHRPRCRSQVHRHRHPRRPAAQSHAQPLSLRLPARHAAVAARGAGHRRRADRAAALLRPVPAGDGPGDGQGAGRHDVLRVQPSDVAQRSRRRPPPLWHRPGHLASGVRRCASSTSPTPSRRLRRTTPNAARMSAPASMSCPRCRRRGANASCAGAR